jgi:tetratricopeptide (TPR) repeat protein
MTKTYQNTKLGIEIDVPENWLIPGGEAIKTQFGDAIIFYCGLDENFNIEIGRSFSESLEHIEREFRRYAQSRKYTTIEFGRIFVGNKEHVHARYRMGTEDWAKKYLIVFGEIEYDMTANCFDQQSFVEREQIWDSIVRSFRVIAPVKPPETTNVTDRIYQAALVFDKGYGYFQSGNYLKALEFYEKGKLITHEYPSNFFGVSMTLMQMIEVGAIPKNQIRLALRNAEKNLELCLLISPSQEDYIEAMKIIQDFKRKLEV